jgi:hypothetical protein
MNNIHICCCEWNDAFEKSCNNLQCSYGKQKHRPGLHYKFDQNIFSVIYSSFQIYFYILKGNHT